MPADLRHGSYTPTYIEREELHEELTGLTRWNDSDAERSKQAGDVRDFVGMDEGVRDCELLLPPVAVGEDDISAPVFLARVSSKRCRIDSRRADLVPKRVPLIVDLPDEDAAI